MNRLNTDWLPVQAEAHQSWPPKKNCQTNKKRKTEEKNTLLYNDDDDYVKNASNALNALVL